MLIIICGLPGSGKSSLSRRLKRILPAIHLNTDKVRKEVFPNPKYTEQEKKMVYDEIVNQTEKQLLKKRNVIVDATFYSKKYRQRVINVARDTKTKYYVIKCILSEEMIKKRLEMRGKRGTGVSDADYEIYLKVKEKFESIEEKHLEVDCSLEGEEQVKKAMDYLGVKHGKR